MFKNLNEIKKNIRKGMKFKIIEHAINHQSINKVREIEKVQSNGIKASGVWLYWQKAKNMRFNNDNTIDFLLGEEVKNKWLIEKQAKEGKDYWLKIRFI